MIKADLSYFKLTFQLQTTTSQNKHTLSKIKGRDQIFVKIIKKMTSADITYLRALESTLNEWHSDNDDKII